MDELKSYSDSNEYVEHAVRFHGSALQFASTELQQKQDLINLALKENPEAENLLNYGQVELEIDLDKSRKVLEPSIDKDAVSYKEDETSELFQQVSRNQMTVIHIVMKKNSDPLDHTFVLPVNEQLKPNLRKGTLDELFDELESYLSQSSEVISAVKNYWSNVNDFLGEVDASCPVEAQEEIVMDISDMVFYGFEISGQRNVYLHRMNGDIEYTYDYDKHDFDFPL